MGVYSTESACRRYLFSWPNIANAYMALAIDAVIAFSLLPLNSNGKTLLRKWRLCQLNDEILLERRHAFGWQISNALNGEMILTECRIIGEVQ